MNPISADLFNKTLSAALSRYSDVITLTTLANKIASNLDNSHTSNLIYIHITFMAFGPYTEQLT